ncbi:MAG: class I SAM-dependent methyltransferase [Candidatus Omnitrophota bacterium]
MSEAINVPQEVKGLYTRYPFPGPGLETEVVENFRRALAFLRVSPDELRNASALDAGCGTGIVAAYLASRCKDVKALDLTSASLEMAKERAERGGFLNIEFRLGSVFDLPFPEQKFDLVLSRGVLHHTEDAYRGFCRIASALRPGGRIIVSLYHRYGRLRHRLRRARVARIAGEDIERRVETAERLYFLGTPDSEKERIRSLISDQYAHPHETYHTGGQVMRWFRENGIEYASSYYPIHPTEYFQLEEALFPEEALQRSGKHRAARAVLRGMKAARIDKAMALLGGGGALGRTMMELSWFFFNIQYFYMTGIKKGD